MKPSDKVYVAGHKGMVGSSIVRLLERSGYSTIVYASSSELDLRRQSAVEEFFDAEKPDYVFLAAAKVGGIGANNGHSAEFLSDNASIALNIINASVKSGVTKLLNLGSSCIYPRLCKQPIKEEYLMTGPLEPTNEGYALAKIVSLKYCEYLNEQYGLNYISMMPCNIYGQGDTYNPVRSHVVPAMIQRFHEAKRSGDKTVTVWGTGTARRELMYVDDLAEAALFLMQEYSSKEFINVGTGIDVTIGELAAAIANVVGFEGKICFDKTKPDGMPRKLMDSSRINEMGWRARTSLIEGLGKAYSDYLGRCSE